MRDAANGRFVLNGQSEYPKRDEAEPGLRCVALSPYCIQRPRSPKKFQEKEIGRCPR